MSSVAISVAAPRSRQRRRAAAVLRATPWVLAAAAGIALISLAMPRFADRLEPNALLTTNGFAGGSFRVGRIERAPAVRSRNRLVRVRCGGAAARTSFCWVARR